MIITILFQQEKIEEEEYRFKVATGNYASGSSEGPGKKKKYKTDGYFSDEEEEVDT